MSGLYVEYPSGGSGTTSVGSYANLGAFPSPPPTGMYLAVAEDTDTLYVWDANSSTWLAVGGTAVPLAVGALDGASKNAFGATIGSNSAFMQTADATFPGLVSSAAQSFSGTKTFGDAPQFSALTSNLPAALGSGSFLTARSLLFGSPDVIGSVSLVTQVSGQLPITQTSGSVSLVNKVTGSLPLSQTSGSISLTNQVNGILPFSSVSGSVSLVNQVSGNLPLSQTSGSLSLTAQVVNNLPLAQTSGSISLTAQVSGILPQARIPTTLNIGSVTMTSSVGGAAYTVTWPGAQGTANTVPLNNGAGSLAWATILTNPMTTSGDIIVSSGSGVAARLPLGAENTVLKSTLAGAGAHSYDYVEGPVSPKTANYAVGSSDTTILCSSSAFFLTLPPPANIVGQKFKILKTDSNVAGPTVIQTTSSQSILSGSAGAVITSIQLNGLGDYAEVVAVSSGGYFLTGSRMTARAFFSLATGGGTVSTTVRAFSTTVTNFGNAFVATAGSGTATGCTIAINQAGVYSFSYTDVFGNAGGEVMGLTLNSPDLTADVTNVTNANILSMQNTALTDQPGNCSWTGYLKPGDVVRPQFRSGTSASSVPGRARFLVDRIN